MKKETNGGQNGGKPQIRELTLLHGVDFPSDYELIMLILGSGTRARPVESLAKEALRTVLESNREQLIEKLAGIKGIGLNRALAVAASIELGRRMNRKPQGHLSRPVDVIPYIQSYAMQAQEHFLCVSVNGAREILSIRVVCVGSGNMAVLHPAEVFSEPIKEHASAIIVSHNHPGGNPSPSEEDRNTTERLTRAADILGIPLLDHIIISKSRYFSFMENGLLSKSAP